MNGTRSGLVVAMRTPAGAAEPGGVVRRRARALLAAIAVAVAASAVARPVSADPPASPFAGTWSGPYVTFDGNFSGTLEWTISDAGAVEGTAYYAPWDLRSYIYAHIGDGGHIVGTGINKGINADPGSGDARIDERGHMVGTWVLREDGSGLTYDLARP